jgi:hypothetical protein
MINSELLKEAIADAKAVRATALANAKASLEEAFAPRFEAMFADKLKEESEDGMEEQLSEVEAANNVAAAGGEANPGATKAVSKGQPKKGSAANTPYKAVAVGGSEGAAGSKAPAAKQSIVKETEEVKDEEEEKIDENAGLTSEDLDEIIAELEAEVGEEEAGQPVPPAPIGDVGAAAPVPSAPLPAAPGAGAVPQCPPAPVVGDAAPAPVPGAEAPMAPVDGEAPAAVPGLDSVPPAAPAAAPGDEEEIDLEELLSALNEEADGDDDEDDKKKKNPFEKMDEISNNGLPKNVGGADKAGKTVSNKNIEANKTPNTQGEIGGGETGGKPKLEEFKIALKEAYDTIGYLRGQINEVNLLNAKLLYTNKLFKEFAGVLDDSYRMKIVENFDLTKSVREVKLAYALLAESLNFGTRSSKQLVSTKPAQKKAAVQIAEGLASKPVASTKPSKELISEGSAMATRFQKLAGIKTLIK